jgi:site-specific recombinase XerD
MGYNVQYARRLLLRTMRALETARFPSDHRWTAEHLLRAFCRFRPRRDYLYAQHVWTRFLDSCGRLAPQGKPMPRTPVLDAYAQHLRELRGLAADTIKNHRWQVDAFLRSALHNGEDTAALSALRIERFIQQRSRTVSRASLRQTVDALRAFLRFCFSRKLIATRLDEIDRPVLFRDERPPRALPWSCIQRLLQSIDRRDRTGWRDFMMLHLMAHYGLRPGEVARLRRDSINWAEGTLQVEQSKTYAWLVLPLGQPTLRLLDRYLHSHRADLSTGMLFPAACAPQRAMTKYSVSQVFRTRARRSGLPLAHASSYSLRHSFAMRLFGRGVGIKVIGDLMGHRSIVSTAVYLRLQSEVLRKVALPVPTARAGGAA